MSFINKILISVLFSTGFLSGCQQARVDRWIIDPCQPHGFYVAPKGQTLADVAATCHIDERILYQYNAWLTTRQPFTENTVVWLRKNPLIADDDENLQMGVVEISTQPALSAEILQPLGLPQRKH